MGLLLSISLPAFGEEIESFPRIDFDTQALFQSPAIPIAKHSMHQSWLYRDLQTKLTGHRLSIESLKDISEAFESQIISRVFDIFDFSPKTGEQVQVFWDELGSDDIGKSYKGYFNAERLGPFSFLVDLHYMWQGPIYAKTLLTHELAHVVQFQFDPDEETFVNEGTAILMESYLFGTTHSNSISIALQNPGESLTDFSNRTHENYGNAYLFFHYLSDHFGGKQLIRKIIHSPLNGIESIDAALSSENARYRNSPIDFKLAFRYFSLAKLLNTISFNKDRLFSLGAATWKTAFTATYKGQEIRLKPYSSQFFEFSPHDYQEFTRKQTNPIELFWVLTNADELKIISNKDRPDVTQLKPGTRIRLAAVNPSKEELVQK